MADPRTIDDISCLEILAYDTTAGGIDGLRALAERHNIPLPDMRKKAFACANDAANIHIPFVGKSGSEKTPDTVGGLLPQNLQWSLFTDSQRYVVLWTILTLGLVALSFNKKAGGLAVGLAFGVFFAVAVTIMRERKML